MERGTKALWDTVFTSPGSNFFIYLHVTVGQDLGSLGVQLADGDGLGLPFESVLLRRAAPATNPKKLIHNEQR
jgi:hypothetical protein